MRCGREEGDSISFQLQIQLPEGITFPEGTYFSEVGTNGITVQYTGTDSTGGEVITIPLPEGVTVEDIGESDIAQVSEDLSTLTLSITQAIHPAESSGEPTEPGDSSGAGESASPITEWDYTVTVKGEPHTVSESFQEGQITISGMDAEGESLGEMQKISVNAEEITVSADIRPTLGASITKTIIFQDNNNEDGLRPDKGVFQDLPIYFSKDEGTTWRRLAWEDLPELGMESWPQPNVTKNGAQYTVTYEELTSKVESISSANGEVTQTTNIQWSFSPNGVETGSVPPAVDGYTAQVGENGTWYYLLNQEFTFTAQLRWGDLGSGQEVQYATGETFSLYYIGEDNQPVFLGTLKKLEDQGRLTYENQSTTPIITDVTISGYPEYDQNGNPIQYYVDLTAGHDETLDSSDGITALTGGDKITASFSNAGVPGYDAVSDRIYSGGTLTLTLTGTTHFSATKVWLDQAIAVEDKENSRPTVFYSLWRRREGTSYHESQQLTNYTVTRTSDSAGDENSSSDRYKLTVQDKDGTPVDLPKYDSDGYPYVYFLKESMSGGSNSYQQVFGTYQVDENGNVVYDENGDPVLEEGSDPLPKNYYGGGSRRDEDMGVYNNGTISNRLTETTTATLNKSWKASAFQGDLENVTVTFRLQYRPADNPDSKWFNTDITRTQNGVTEESMASWTESAQVDKYGPLGKKLVYRWVEESITQNEEPVELGPEEYIEDGQGRSILTRTFTLKHGKTGVTYRSETVYNQETGETTITNTVEDTLDYYVTKEWRGGRTPKKITINLYRMVSGAELNEDTPIYISFTWDGDAGTFDVDLEHSMIDSWSTDLFSPSSQKTENGTTTWDTVINNLPRFNENGQEYEYLLLEDTSGQEGFPIYKTERDEDGSYHTTVINGEGKGSMILVRKEWTDDTDIEHRGDVTIEVRLKSDPDQKIAEATIPEGVTTIEVGIGEHKPDQVFILETAVTVDGERTRSSWIFHQ